jgi:putative nucleotidyltransferase with HDIG domain
MLYLRFGGLPSVADFQLASVGFAVAAATYLLVSVSGTSIVIALSTGVSLSASWRRLVGSPGSLVFDLAAAPLGLLLAFLYTKAQLLGVLVITLPLFMIRHVYSVSLQIEQVNRDLLELMVKAIEARDPYTSGHSQRVSQIAALLARELRLSAKQTDLVETAALLHDVGKIHEEYAVILRKAGRLGAEEIALMRTHPIRSYELVRTISGFRGGVDLAVRHHHEHFDGSGYPDGLSGHSIPIGARIIMVADTADAMTTDRPYRLAMDFETVVRELRRYSGSQFDPQLVDVFASSAAVRVLVESNGKPKPEREKPVVLQLASR